MLDDNDKQWIRTELKAELDSVLSHVLSEIGRRAEEQTARWESIDARLTLQAGLFQSGSRARGIDLDKRVRVIEDRLKDAA